mgnify:CR=1 FL=1
MFVIVSSLSPLPLPALSDRLLKLERCCSNFLELDFIIAAVALTPQLSFSSSPLEVDFRVKLESFLSNLLVELGDRVDLGVLDCSDSTLISLNVGGIFLSSLGEIDNFCSICFGVEDEAVISSFCLGCSGFKCEESVNVCWVVLLGDIELIFVGELSWWIGGRFDLTVIGLGRVSETPLGEVITAIVWRGRERFVLDMLVDVTELDLCSRPPSESCLVVFGVRAGILFDFFVDWFDFSVDGNFCSFLKYKDILGGSVYFTQISIGYTLFPELNVKASNKS